ncbi:hypothetical protein [Flavobacterium gilvum]|uniref:Uncharacterized protein n=1 Tax=Flavobacterium gilvum TaxID=1492737 RepID=A0AAC9I436_9FLAO|nr:hypothetical protein [Flavobacterium gilvum]AOW10479.1 hypothetical protein EM308_13755 [Flavobacterium gilvum]KFC61141.1 hypothetical protein FEM08_00770 [Flavobacterium gilvum]
MIHTIVELIYVINDCEIKIKQYEIKQDCFHQNYDELKRLEEKKNVLKKQIECHIQEFKEKIKNNYLEARLYANILIVLEKKFELQPRIMNANLFCLNILKEKHSIIKKDKTFFSRIGKDRESIICENELQMIEMQSQDLLYEFFEKNNKFPTSIDKETKQQFNALLHHWGFVEKKKVLDKRRLELEIRLELLEKALKGRKPACGNYKPFSYELGKNINDEIMEIKRELLEIKIQQSKNIDYIL